MAVGARRATFLREQAERVLNLLGRTVARQPVDATIEEGVDVALSTDDVLEARVRAGGIHRVRVGPSGGDWSCSCAGFSRDMACEHLLATLRVAVEDAPGDAELETRPDWLDTLEDVAEAASGPEVHVWGAVEPTSERIVYLLRIDGEAHAARTDLAVMLQRRTATGTWGKPRAVRLKDLSPEHPAVETDDDRLLLALLAGLDRSWTKDWRSKQATDGPFRLDDERGMLALERAAATGRLHLATARDMDPAPIELALDRPWTLGSEPREAGDTVIFEHYLERGTRRVEPDALKLVQPTGEVVVDRELTRIDPQAAANLLCSALRHGSLVVPAADAPRAALEIARRVTSLAQADAAPEAAPPLPVVRIERPTTGRSSARYDAHLTFDYGSAAVKSSSRDPFVKGEDGELRRRNLIAERTRIEEFLAAGGTRQLSDPENSRDATLPRAEFEAIAEHLMGLGWVVEAEGRTLRTSSGTSISVVSGVDWFDLQAGVRFGDQEAALPALLDAARSGSRFVTLGDGSRGILPRDWVDSWRGAALGKVDGDVVRFDRSTAWLLSALLEGREVEFDEPFARLREEVHRMQTPESLPEPEGFTGSLRDYQREGLGWLDLLDRLGLGGCLADEMGLGKTVQLLAHLQRRVLRTREEGAPPRRPSLVVAPRSLVFNWLAEARRFTPDLVVHDHTGAARGELPNADADLIVTTYGTLRRDAPRLSEFEFDVVVLDEGQAIKNRSSQTAKAARLLRAGQRVVLTGTPIENHLGELWSMMEFLNPGFGEASSAFRKLGGTRTLRDLSEEQRTLLTRALRPFFLRRTKAIVARELPPRTEQVIECQLVGQQADEYREMRDYFRAALSGQAKMGVQVIQGLLRLRQLACHPGLIDDTRAGDTSAKLETVLALLEDVIEGGGKALVFSQFTTFLGIVRAALDERGWKYAYLDGRTRKRQEAVERFQEDPDTPLFLVSLKAGGSGLNLTAADYVLLLDPWWNPAAEAQAIDRAHRIGRERPVHVYRLVARDTIEERVLELQDSKRDLAAAVLGGTTSALSDLGPEDLQFLLS